MFCTTCGKKLLSGAEFCTGCGKKLSGSSGAVSDEIKKKSRRLRNASIIFVISIACLVAYLSYAVKYFAPETPAAATAAVISVFGIIFLTIAYLIVLLVNIKTAIFNCRKKILYFIHRPVLGISIISFVILIPTSIWICSFVSKPSFFQIIVFKGPVSGATVNIYELTDNGEKGKLIQGPLTSDASGIVDFELPSNLPKRFIIESQGGSYKSEATGQTVQLKNTDVLTAMLLAGTDIAAVTPFTHMAAALAKARIQGGMTPDSAIILANADVAKQYGLKTIVYTAPVDSTMASVESATEEEKKYGLLLAGFAQLAKNNGVRSIDLANALAKDWSDGVVDGTENGNPVTIANGPKLSKEVGTAGLAKAVEQFSKIQKEKGYTSIKDASTVVTPNPPAQATGFHITTTALPNWVSGQTGSYTVTAVGGSSPYAWKLKSGSLPPGFTLSQDGIISGTFTLSSDMTKKIFPPFTLEVKDQQNQTQTVTLSLTVAHETPSISVINPPTLTVGQSYDEVIATANGGMPPYKFGNEIASGPIPMGMQITAVGNQAHLVGSPKAKGNFYFRVCVIDSASNEKCGEKVAFAVKEAAKEYYGYEITKWDWSLDKDCGVWRSYLTAFSVYGNNLKVSNFTYEGVFDSSGLLKIITTQTDSINDTITIQRYGSGENSYLKGDETLIRTYKYFDGSEKRVVCTYYFTAEQK